jgi:predicted Fe-Mo cluster-binding NifX family protein
MLLETDTLAYEALANEGMDAVQGAGIAAAQKICNRGVEALVTGRVGLKARAALQTAGIAIHERVATCTVREAVARFHSGVQASRTGPEFQGGFGPQKDERGNSGRANCSGSGPGRGRGGRCRDSEAPGKGRRR